MVPYQRYELIIRTLKQSRFISIKELQKLTKSSITTLRRDINYLAEKGRITKTRGGVAFADKSESESKGYLYNERKTKFYDAKEMIGLKAQEFIENEEILFLTNGTTTYHVARNIDSQKHITVITNGLDIVDVLQDKPNVNVILLGGMVNYAYHSVAGPAMSRMLEEMNPTKIIMGAGGITREKGITIYDYIYGSYLKRAIEGLNNIYVVADHSKFGRNMLSKIIPLERINTIITDVEVPEEFSEVFDDLNIACHIGHMMKETHS
jgi:DeoR/GlpR family transcriptional regulator of sugar metabolism